MNRFISGSIIVFFIFLSAWAINTPDKEFIPISVTFKNACDLKNGTAVYNGWTWECLK